jgi:SAM-dependent methyltransferase
MSDQHRIDPPSPFVVEWIRAVAGDLREPRRALDVAMGRGRHTGVLADAGLRVFGVDSRFDAVRDAVERAAREGVVVRGWCADLTRGGLPRNRFELLLVTRYLQRDLFHALRETLVPGGVVIYETFTEAQRAHGRGPASPDHLLQPGELQRHFADFDMLFAEEVIEPEAVARIVARRPAGACFGSPSQAQSSQRKQTTPLSSPWTAPFSAAGRSLRRRSLYSYDCPPISCRLLISESGSRAGRDS